MDHTAGTDLREYVVVGPTPVDNSVFYTLLDHTGSVVAGHDNVAIVTTDLDTVVEVYIPSSDLQISGGRTFEKRTLEVVFQNSSGYYRKVKNFRLVPRLNLYVGQSDVRGLLGVNETELSDSDISLFTAYLQVKQDVSNLDTYLVAGDFNEIKANKLVATKAALDVIPSLKLRIAQSQSDGQVSFDRIDISTLDDLFEALSADYAAYANELNGVDPNDVQIDLFEVVTRPDPFTGT